MKHWRADGSIITYLMLLYNILNNPIEIPSALQHISIKVPIPGLRRREDPSFPSIFSSGDIHGPAYSKSTLPIAIDIFNKRASALDIADNMEVFKEKTKAILYI
ncbi:hypothetical protein M8J77_005642 [Diaphorina citri]|nr:hypothetical protein M8J77_005642 [Diaphorina citri]